MPLTRKNLNLSAQQVAWFDALAEKTGISASELIRRALDEWRKGDTMQQAIEQETPEQTYFRLAMGFRLAIDRMLAEGKGPLEPGQTIEGYSRDGYKLMAYVTDGGPTAQLAMDIWKPDGEKLVIDKAKMAQLQTTMIQLHHEEQSRNN